MKRWLLGSIALVIAALLQSVHMGSVTLVPAQQPQPIQNTNVPRIPFESVPDYFKYSAQMNLGEVLGVAVNSKGRVVVLNHPGSATSGPLYGNATTQLLEFDEAGKFVREIGHGVYGLGYAHSVRFDKYDNLWVVDKGTHTVMKFNPAGYVTDEPRTAARRGRMSPITTREMAWRAAPRTVRRRSTSTESSVRRPTSRGTATTTSTSATATSTRAWPSSTSTGTGSSRGARRGAAGHTRTKTPASINNPHNIGIDRQNNVYVADRGNRRIQVFDRDGNFQRFILLNAPYDKTRHPVLGNPRPESARRDAAVDDLHHARARPQYLYTSDSEPGRIYKLTLDGKIVGHARRVGPRDGPVQLGCTASRARRRTCCTSPT